MKRTIDHFIITYAILLIVTPGTVNSQALQKGDLDIHAGTGFGILNLTTNDFEDDQHTGVPGLLSLGVAYQFNEKWSVGLNYERMGFLTEADSNEKAVTHNFGLISYYNLSNNEKNVFSILLDAGISSFRYDDFKEEDYVTSTGFMIQPGGSWKHYWGDHIGFYLNLSVPIAYYSEFRNKDDDLLEVSEYDAQSMVIRSRVFDLSMVGVNFRAGLVLKL
jgi:hypothetical protein